MERTAKTIGIHGVERRVDEFGNGLTEYLRDPEGRVLEMKYPGGRVHLAYDHDTAGNVKAIRRLGDSEETLYEIDPDNGYDAMGHLLSTKYGNHVEDVHEYYGASQRLKSTKTQRPSAEGEATEGLPAASPSAFGLRI